MIMLLIITSYLLQILKSDKYEEQIQDNYDYFSCYSIICWTIQLNDKIENLCEYKLIVVGKSLSVYNFHMMIVLMKKLYNIIW